MKKKIFLLLTIFLALCQTAMAYDFSVEVPSGQTLYFNIFNSNTVVLTSQNTSSPYYTTYPTGDLIIPATVIYNDITYNVEAMDGRAFYGCKSLTSVTIPNSVTIIGGFYNCSSLTSVTIPNSVTHISDMTFYNCRALTSVTIPNSVIRIGEYAFYGCSGLTSVTIPNSVTYIRDYTFFNCKNLISVTIPNSVTIIGEAAFYNCRNLTSVTIPNSVTCIGGSAFAGCIGLTSVTIPNSVTSIGYTAFYGCSGLTSVTIPNSVTSIERAPFAGCSNLTSIVVESNNTHYDSRENCNAIIQTDNNQLVQGCQNTIIPSSVASIGDFAFYGCSGLTSVAIGNLVTNIGENAFSGCSSLTTVTIPNSVTSIKYAAFSGCSGLTSVTIPNTVTSIGENAFWGCSGLTSVAIPNSVTSIGNWAFEDCTSLTSVTIPNLVTSIDDGAFMGCSGLTEIHSLASEPPALGDNVFYNVNSSIPVYVPCGAASGYNGWGGFSNIQEEFTYTLTVASNNETMGSVEVSAAPTCSNNTASLTATPNDGYLFVQWNDDNRDNPRSITVTKDTSFVAEFAPWSQETACPGWNNPANFSVGNSNYNYTGQTGDRSSGAPNMMTGSLGGMQLTSQMYNRSAMANVTFTTYGDCADIPNPNNAYAIMSSGYDANTGDQLPYVPSQLNTNITKSIRIGDACGGHNTNGLNYNLRVTPDNALFYIYYACVIEDPGGGGHGVANDPALVIRVLKQNNSGNWVQLTNVLSYATSASEPSMGGTMVDGVDGWHHYQVSSYQKCWWKEWTKMRLDLSNYMDEDLRIQVVTGDCGYSQHFGYAYIAGECRPLSAIAGYNVRIDNIVNGSVTGAGDYAANATVTLTATPNNGYQFVQWNSNGTLVSSNNPFTFTITKDTVLTPVFEAISPTPPLECEEYQWPVVPSPYPDVQIKQKHDHISAYASQGWDTVVNENAPIITLSATPTVSVAQFNGTYLVEEIPYNPADPTFNQGTKMPMSTDDNFGPAVSIPFPFYFFGIRKTEFAMSGNGTMTFNGAAANQSCPWSYSAPLPWPDGTNGAPSPLTYMRDAVYGVYEDLHPGILNHDSEHPERGMYYGIQGIPAIRKIVCSWNEVPLYSCTSLKNSYQIVCYEGTNIIEVHVRQREACTSWRDGRGLIGIQNATGLPQVHGDAMSTTMYVVDGSPAAFYPSGYNTFSSNLTNKAFRFSPQGSRRMTCKWYRVFDDGRDSIDLTQDVLDPNGYFIPMDEGSNCPLLTRAVVRPTEPSKYVCEVRFRDANGNWYALTDTCVVGTDFPATTYTVTATSADETMGAVTGGGTYTDGSTATLTAIANDGYDFVRWNDNDTDNPRTVTVVSDTTFTAYFAVSPVYTTVDSNVCENKFPITWNGVMFNGAGSKTATLQSHLGGDSILTMNVYIKHTSTGDTTATAYDQFTWYGQTYYQSTEEPTHLFTNAVGCDSLVTLHLTINPSHVGDYEITATADDAAKGTVSGGGSYDAGEVVTLTATANCGYQFKRWSDSNTDNPRTISVAGDASYLAEFELASYTFETPSGQMLNYVVDCETQTACVTGYTGVCRGLLVIPPLIRIEGVIYVVVSIGPSAFEGNTGLLRVMIPGTVDAIYESAFRGCTNLAKVEGWYQLKGLEE